MKENEQHNGQHNGPMLRVVGNSLGRENLREE